MVRTRMVFTPGDGDGPPRQRARPGLLRHDRARVRRFASTRADRVSSRTAIIPAVGSHAKGGAS
jgi:hypothetical protein